MGACRAAARVSVNMGFGMFTNFLSMRHTERALYIIRFSTQVRMRCCSQQAISWCDEWSRTDGGLNPKNSGTRCCCVTFRLYSQDRYVTYIVLLAAVCGSLCVAVQLPGPYGSRCKGGLNNLKKIVYYINTSQGNDTVFETRMAMATMYA
jgi:hypothetical protein